jgi:NADPH:quinone reductase-like Zn-dependent oxidoreductase
MNAILQAAYGQPDVLRLGEIERPRLRDDGVIVRVRASSLNKGDWHLLTGKPYLIRIAGYGFSKPINPILGMCVAGMVEAVGPSVKTWKVGDAVFGEVNRGGFAEYICVGEQELALKPDSMSFEEAATLPIAATTALQGLRDAGALKAGERVLVIGAAGGVGTFAVQIAKAMGATVTGVCRAKNLELVHSLGADSVIDYGRENFWETGKQYDLIFDLVGNQPLSNCRRALTEKGRYLSAAGGAEHEFVGPMFTVLWGLFSNLFSSKRFVPVMAKPQKADLEAVAQMIEAGQMKTVIDQRYTLAEVPAGMRYLGLGHSRGKSVVTM